jgi:hypothetical protein
MIEIFKLPAHVPPSLVVLLLSLGALAYRVSGP